MTTAKQEPFPFRFTVRQYYDLAEKGVLAPDAHIELIRGEIIEMFPQGPFHASQSSVIYDWFLEIFRDLARVRMEKPVILSDHSSPEPDIAVVTLNSDDPYYRNGHPTEKDIHLLIEISDSSYLHDRNVKLPLYAEFEIPEVWIINVQQRQIEVYRQPANGEYGNRETYSSDSDAVLTPIEFSHQKFPVKQFGW